jgi:hypothetical protein
MNLRNKNFELVDIRFCSESEFEEAIAILAYDCAWNLIAEARRIRAKNASTRVG